MGLGRRGRIASGRAESISGIGPDADSISYFESPTADTASGRSVIYNITKLANPVALCIAMQCVKT